MAEQADRRGESRQSFYARQLLIDSSRTAFQLLSAVLKNVALYPPSHPIMLSGAEKLRNKIREMTAGREEVPFYVIGGELFIEKISVPIDQSLALVLEQFANRDIGGVFFRPGLTTEDIIKFSILMNQDPSVLSGEKDLDAILAQEDIRHIILHRVLLSDKQKAEEGKSVKQKPSEIFRDTVETVKEMVGAVQLNKVVNVRKVNHMVQTMVDNILDNRDAFVGLTNLKMYDEYTFAHSVNVSVLSISLGTFLGFDKAQIAALGLAGLMHDIGKMTIPREIINKPGKLTDEEWDAVKRHPVEGALLLASSPGISKLAMVASFEHHQHGERGYPGTGGSFHQHPFSQIVSLTDAYDAITAARVYYSSQTPPDEGVRILLKKRGAPFNAVLVNAFVKMIGLFPIGCLVKLDTGEIGMVMHQTSNLMQPRILILSKFDGSEKGGQTVSLLETSQGMFKRSIVGTVNAAEAKIDVKRYLE